MSMSYRSRLMQAIVGGAILVGAQSLNFGALADTTLNALFMAQAAYSEDNVRAMTADFRESPSGPEDQLSNSSPAKACMIRRPRPRCRQRL